LNAAFLADCDKILNPLSLIEQNQPNMNNFIATQKLDTMQKKYQTIEMGEEKIQFAEIPQGQIQMNDDRIKKKWEVTIDAFLLAKFPITQGFYFNVMHQSPSTFKGTNLPVESITWKEAAEFCNRLSQQLQLNPCYHFVSDKITFDGSQNGFRLPLEAEWQFACQANAPQIRYGELDEIAWYKQNAANHTHEVGLKQPNAWGLYDMLGNVWEWCSDVYDEEVYGAYRVFRGGGWSDAERSVMATTRRRSHPTQFKIDDLGFRIAKNIEQ